MTPEQKAEAIDKLAESISKLCHAVIRRRLGQFFEVIEEEMAKRDRCGVCSPAEFGGPTCACATQETIPAPEQSIQKAFARSPRRISPIERGSPRHGDNCPCWDCTRDQFGF